MAAGMTAFYTNFKSGGSEAGILSVIATVLTGLLAFYEPTKKKRAAANGLTILRAAISRYEVEPTDEKKRELALATEKSLSQLMGETSG